MTKKTLNETQEELLAPVVGFNELALASAQRLIDLQVDGIKKYSDVAMNNWAEALKVKDVAGAQKYVAKQADVAKQVADNLTADAEALMNLGREFATEASKLAEPTAFAAK